MRDGARDKLISTGYEPAIIAIDSVREEEEVTVGSGGGVVLWAETSGGCLIGGTAVSSKGNVPADVGRTAAAELISNLEHGGCVDEYLQVHISCFRRCPVVYTHVRWLQDQIIILMALAEGKSTVRTGPMTLHTK